MKRAIAFFVSIVILMVTNTVLASDGANIDCVKEISAFPVGASTRMTTYGGEGKLLYHASQGWASAKSHAWPWADATYLYASIKLTATVGGGTNEKEKTYNGTTKDRVLNTEKVYSSASNRKAVSYHRIIGNYNGTERYAASKEF